MKRGYNDNIETLTVDNGDFRRVLYTGKHLQLVLMTLQPGEEIGSEVHDDRDQFFRFEEGEGVVVGAGAEFEELGRNALEESSLASYAIADGALFIRTEQHLYRIEKQ